MSRSISMALLFVLTMGLLCTPGTAFAGEKKKKKAVPLKMASDEEASEVLKTFKVDYKAKGLDKDDKISQRIYAMEQIMRVQHPSVIDALAKVSRSSDSDLRMLALIYLGEQKLNPHEAGKAILASMKKNRKDTVLVMTGLQSIGSLKYLGAKKEIATLLKHSDYVVKKSAIATVGATRDVRLLRNVLSLIGLKIESEANKTKDSDKKSGGSETTEEGYSWEGAESTVDHGDADNTAENAEAQANAEAQIAANRSAAEASSGAGSGTSTGGAGSSIGGGSGGGRGASGRNPDELIPGILRTLKALTGEKFDHPRTIKAWLAANRAAVQRQMVDLDRREKEQKKKKS